MGVAERREREKARRRVDIIDAAERVFFSRGVEAATMDEVAEATSSSKRTLEREWTVARAWLRRELSDTQ